MGEVCKLPPLSKKLITLQHQAQGLLKPQAVFKGALLSPGSHPAECAMVAQQHGQQPLTLQQGSSSR